MVGFQIATLIGPVYMIELRATVVCWWFLMKTVLQLWCILWRRDPTEWCFCFTFFLLQYIIIWCDMRSHQSNDHFVQHHIFFDPSSRLSALVLCVSSLVHLVIIIQCLSVFQCLASFGWSVTTSFSLCYLQAGPQEICTSWSSSLPGLPSRNLFSCA